jgi:adenosylcobyric acid synthase
MGNAVAVLGSGSDVGKSLVTAGLCRLFRDAGLDVAPFKAQNMANQAGVTADGLEMPRAQILQARACGLEPEVDMGPVLMKPVTPTGAQIILLGRALGAMEARDYFGATARFEAAAFQALDRLRARHRVIVLEGAGSPVELNLMARDFVNLKAARHAGAGLVLVLDIDKGGVFAQAKGTLDLLPPADRARVLGLVVNRFRGDPALFEDAIPMLEDLCGVPVLAVLPWVDHALDEEDRPIRIPVDAPPAPGRLNVGAILSPRVANTEDLAPLLAEPDLHLTWITSPALARRQDLLILPGSKATLGDLAHHAASGMAEAVRAAHRGGAWVLGLCGGYQMLGETLEDPLGGEGGPSRWDGLGLLPLATVFAAAKTTEHRSYTSLWPEPGHTLRGYEIHQGQSAAHGGTALVVEGGGALGLAGTRAAGAYLHGLLQNDGWRSAFLNEVRQDRGLPAQPAQAADPLELRLRRWAGHVRAHLRPGAWERLLSQVSGPEA